MIEEPPVALGVEDDLARRRGRSRTARDDPHAQARRLVDPLPVGPEARRRRSAQAPRSSRPVAVISIVVWTVRWCGRTWPRYFHVSSRPDADGLEAGPRDPLVHPRLEHEELQRLDHRLDPEGAGLHRVLEEVGLEEPLARVDVLHGPQLAEPGPARAGPEAVDAVEHQEHRPGEPRPARVEERAAAATSGRRGSRSGARGARGGRRGREARPGSRARPAGRSRRRSSSRRPAASPAEQVTSNDSMIIAPVAETAFSFTRVVSVPESGRTSPRSVPVPSRLRKPSSSVDAEGRADVAREPAARLERRLEQDRERHRPAAVLVEVPGVGRDVVLDGRPSRPASSRRSGRRRPSTRLMKW